jgi:hypothetical protein
MASISLRSSISASWARAGSSTTTVAVVPIARKDRWFELEENVALVEINATYPLT